MKHLQTRNPFLYFWHHPRRTGFMIFNVIVLALLAGWAVAVNSQSHDGIGALPNLMLGYTGIVLVAVAWIVGWIAWAIMVTSRHAARHPGTAVPPTSPSDR